MENFIDFKEEIEDMKQMDFNPIPDLVFFKIPYAKENLWRGIKHFAGDAALWKDEYEEVADWMADNKGRGLLCYGECGLGKTLICYKIFPYVLHAYYRKVVSCFDAQQMNENIDIVKDKHLIYLDDIGTENESVKYGQKRWAFPEIADEAEKKGKLLIISTNLSLDQLAQKYGMRTIDRLRAITKPVRFIGDSMRK